MPELLILLRVDAAAVALAACVAAAALIGSHRDEAAAGLAEGLERAAAWRAAAGAALVAGVLWLLETVLRAHGRHRAGVA
jgi:hypothetical protein